MRIRAICVVKNEADVIVETLTAAAVWCDRVFVLDNGSTDGTWEKVQELAVTTPSIVPCGEDRQPFHDGIRSQVFTRFAEEAAPGDWWCRLDGDEFYVDNPRSFLPNVAPRHFSVWSASLSYYFTDADLESYRMDPERFAPGAPVVGRCRYYINHWSEPRFFRHDDGLLWSQADGFPATMYERPVSPRRIRLKHFAYRSPEQIQRRLDARRDNPVFGHEDVEDWAGAVARIRAVGGFRGTPSGRQATWEDRVVPAAALDFDAQDGAYVLNEHLMPPVPASKLLRLLRRADRGLTARVRGLRRSRPSSPSVQVRPKEPGSHVAARERPMS